MGKRGPKITGPQDNERNRRILALREEGLSYNEIVRAISEEFGQAISGTRVRAIIIRHGEAIQAGVRQENW